MCHGEKFHTAALFSFLWQKRKQGSWEAKQALIGTNGSSVAFQKQEIATLDKFYLSCPPEIFEIKIMEIFLFEKGNLSFRKYNLSMLWTVST